MQNAEILKEPVDRLKALTSALDHARAMSTHSADVRMRNFNVFCVITGALIAAIAKPDSPHWVTMAGVAGVLSSLLFLGLDVRGYQMLTYNSLKVHRIEPMLWEYAGLEGYREAPKPKRLVSHRGLYRAFFILVGLGWFAAVIVHLAKK